ncbi:hypothetical protein A7975_10650 [Bacillus sp. FJAT-26390]|nr:hypothetical protein A7975_10650 [Bacillus sp. FJAT-26390]
MGFLERLKEKVFGIDLANKPDKMVWLSIGRRNGKTTLVNELHLWQLEVEKLRAIRSKQIRRLSYRKTKSQRRRG